MLSRKYYVLIAAILKDSNANTHVLELFCSLFARDNPRFNRTKFLHACGVSFVQI